jgi:dTDP-4-dehydrorhamnose 3,5-epimerase
VDLRPESETFGQWIAIELSAAAAEVLYVPKGFGHAYQTLEPDTVLTYFMSEAFVPGTEQGIRWNDALFAIPWPIVPPILSERDHTLADFDLEQHRRESRLAGAEAKGSSPANARSRR